MGAIGKENHGGQPLTDPSIEAMLRQQKSQVQLELQRLQQARSFLNSQARHIRARQQQIYATQQEWKKDMKRVGQVKDSEQQGALRSTMRQVRHILERQSVRLNEETEQVQASFAWVKEWEASLRQLDVSYRSMMAASSSSFSDGDAEFPTRKAPPQNFEQHAAHRTSSARGGLAPSIPSFGQSHPCHAPGAFGRSSAHERSKQRANQDDLVRASELRGELERIADELRSLVAHAAPPAPSTPGAHSPPLEMKAAGSSRGPGRDASWIGQRERVQHLMQSHARWLRKFRDEVAQRP